MKSHNPNKPCPIATVTIRGLRLVFLTVLILAVLAILSGCATATNSPGATVSTPVRVDINASLTPPVEQVLPGSRL